MFTTSNTKCYLLTYLFTPRCRVLPDQLTGLQPIKKFPAFHETRRFITALTSVRHLSLSWASPIQSHLLEICPNIIHPSTPRSPQWSHSLRFPPARPYTPLSPHPNAPHAQPISFFSILSAAQYWVSSTDHSAPRYAVSSKMLHEQNTTQFQINFLQNVRESLNIFLV